MKTTKSSSPNPAAKVLCNHVDIETRLTAIEALLAEVVSASRRTAAGPEMLAACHRARGAVSHFAEMLQSEIHGDSDNGLRRLNYSTLVEAMQVLSAAIAKAESPTAGGPREGSAE